jgi:hypothetical protein
LITSLPIPSGRLESDEGKLEVEEIVGVDVMTVQPGIRMAVSRRIVKTDKNFFIIVASFSNSFYT